jgi:Protein of unknown function (DUF3073)
MPAQIGEGVTHMGRGRQKAKHTKVARELKYFSPNTNYDALERELTGHPSDGVDPAEIEKWAEYAEDDPTQGRATSV